MRRFAIYFFFDPDGIVDEYATYKLEKLREHVETIFVIANEPLTIEGRKRLEAVADRVMTRANSGFDVGAYKDALLEIGWGTLADYDELILLNYTFFGPIHPFGELFDRMDSVDADFWGLTEHRAVRPNPFHDAPDPDELPAHIQSTWIGVRGKMLRSPEFAEYWRTMPEITSYDESVLRHEARFTRHFNKRGFTSVVAFPERDYPSDNPSLDHADLLLDNGCPMVKRRVFFMDPLHMEREGIIGRRTLDRLEASDYPTELVWQNLARTTRARTLLANLSLLEVFGDETVPAPAKVPRIAAIAHIFYVDMVDEVLGRLLSIESGFDLFVTTDTKEKAELIRAGLDGRVPAGLDVRVVASNDGRDVSAFLITCADVFEVGRYDLVCKVHSKRSPQDGFNRALNFKEYLFDNLLGSPGYVSQVLRLFDQNPTLGVVFPPVVNIGYPTLGHGWFTNFEGAEKWSKTLGMNVHLDRTTPLAPLGSMFWARPEALRPLTSYGFTWADFADKTYGDGSITHILERLTGYAALSEGYHLRSVLTSRWAGIGYTFLEYRLQLISSMMPAYTSDQVAYLRELQAADNPFAWAKRQINHRHPRMLFVLRPAYRAGRSTYRWARKPFGRNR